MKKTLVLIGFLLLATLPVYSQTYSGWSGNKTWQQRNAEDQMREDMRRETQRQIEENNRRQQYNQRNNNKYNY
jgi:hypothetical protein